MADARSAALLTGARVAAIAPWSWIAAVALLGASACTDWNEQGGATGPYVQTWSPGSLGAEATGTTDTVGGGNGGLIQWDTWQPPAVDALADAGASDDGPSGVEDAKPLADAETAAEDTGPVDDQLAQVEIVGEDATINPGAADTGSPYTFDGKADFVGWPELPPPPDIQSPPDIEGEDAGGLDDATGDDALPPDAGPDDAAPGDAAPDDAGPPDAGSLDGGSIDSGIADAEPTDTQPTDTQSDDVWAVDGTDPDSSSVDAGGTDSGILDIDPTDTDPADAGTADGGMVDGGMVDGGIADIGITDTGTADSADVSTLPDGAPAPDWQGYGDVPWSEDADVYGGPIGSCLSMYLYQNESCGDIHPTAECIDSIMVDGSLYAQFMFDPLRQCEKAVCVDLCASATDKKCLEQCVAKYCTPQFFACTSNAAVGTQSCADAWQCAEAYPDKFLTISAKCYAAASADAQQQFSSVISCVTQPQKTSCVPQIAECFGAGPQGTEGCGNSANCMNACAGNQYCAWSCLGSTSPKGLELLDAVWGCSVQKCTPKCGGAEPCQGDCLKSECQQELVQCLVN